MDGSGLFSAAGVARLIDEHAAGAFDHSGALWLLLVFEGFLASEVAGGGAAEVAAAA
jgi:asparagine synthase (glutamine-hydrolysing)